MNTKIKVIIFILAQVLVASTVAACVLTKLSRNNESETTGPFETSDITTEVTTTEDTTVAETIESETTIPDTEAPITEVVFFEQDSVKIWDDLTDQISVIFGHKVQFKITNNSTTNIIITPCDLVMNGTSYIGDENYDEVISAGSTVIFTLTFDEGTTINSLSFSLIVSSVIDDEINDLFITDTIVITPDVAA